MAEGTFQVELDLQEHYRFSVRFDDPALPVLVTDEPPPLGAGAGPNPARLLGAAVANCLAASLLFALRKFGNEPGAVHATAAVTLARNEQGRLRVPAIRVDIQLGVPAQALKRLDRALEQFEEFCVVTQSVRAGIAVEVRVTDSKGSPLKR